MNKDKYALFFDLDGTIRFRHGFIPLATKVAIKKAQALGHLAFLNTGRTKGTLPKEADAIDWDGYVLGGTYLEFRGEVLQSIIVPKDVLKGMCDTACELGVGLVLDGESRQYRFNSKLQTNDFQTTEEVISSYDDIKLTKIHISKHLSKDEVSLFSRYMEITDMGSYADAFLKGRSKATGLTEICSFLDIPLENTIAFGDNNNDLSMFSVAKYSVAMLHAPRALKEKATYIATLPFLGIYQGIKKLILK